MTAQEKFSILFVCAANRFRSPIAEGVFRKLVKEKGIEQNWIVGSAGTWAEDGLPVIPSAAWFRDSLGLDLSNHKSRLVRKDLITQFDLALVMEKGQKEVLLIEFPEMRGKISMLTEISKGPVIDIPDPIVNPEVGCLDVASEISRLIINNFQEICLRVAASHLKSDQISS